MSGTDSRPVTAAEIARKRLEDYLTELLAGEFDLTAWEYYTWLLEKARGHKPDRSGYATLYYQADRDAAREIREKGGK
jgi:hypothetical protein